MKRLLAVIVILGLGGGVATAHSPVSVEIVSADGRSFREIPVEARDGALRSYLQAERGATYRVRVHNESGERLGLVIAVDGRNIIDGRKSDLARNEPMYVMGAWDTQDYAGWRASLDAVNEFYFTEWQESYAEAFGDRSARGVIALAVYREVPPPPLARAYEDGEKDGSEGAASVPAEKSAGRARRDESAGTGYGARREDPVREVQFTAAADAESRVFIKYEWPETLCRKRVIDCAGDNRFWDESTLGFAPPPPRHARPN